MKKEERNARLRETLRQAVAMRFTAELAVLAVVLTAKVTTGSAVRLTLRSLIESLPFSAEEIVESLRSIERKELLRITPLPSPQSLDTALRFVACLRPERPESSAFSRPRNVTVDVNGAYIQTVKRNVYAHEASWPRWASQVLGDEQSLACYESFNRRYPSDLLDEAVRAALAVDESAVRSSRGAIFVGTVKRLARERGLDF